MVGHGVVVSDGLLDGGQDVFGAFGNLAPVDGRSDLVEVPADAVQRLGVGFDGMQEFPVWVVLRARLPGCVAECGAQGGVSDETREAFPAGRRSGRDRLGGRGCEADLLLHGPLLPGASSVHRER
ncbi:hypothetical protein [Streptomyces sp. NPDC056132]|uniref:hypothetical protein n=1 Tax=Streptomyces sp. NPDC056132 TaxID=3345722 RepID=UPI0035D90995